MKALDEFIETFLGYGSLHAPIWFLGMEEGGGRDVDELQRRVATWDARGRFVCEDLAQYHRAIGVTQFFDPHHTKLQPTWCALMKALQSWREGPRDLPTLRTIQASELGAHSGSTALLELLPLPAPTAESWPYRELATQRPFLAERSSYVAHVLPQRVHGFHDLLRQMSPQAVVCYGLGYAEHWRSVAGVPLTEVSIENRQCLHGVVGPTQFLAVPHPSRANATRLWEAIGHHLRARSR